MWYIYALNPFFELFWLMMTNGKHSDEKDMYFILVVLQIYCTMPHTSSKQLLGGPPVMLTCPASATTFLPEVLGAVSLYKFTVSRSKENLGCNS
jgi:hypothetical protein